MHFARRDTHPGKLLNALGPIRNSGSAKHFALSQRAALIAARVAVSAAVSGYEGGIWA
jgi:hypothetical protein